MRRERSLVEPVVSCGQLEAHRAQLAQEISGRRWLSEPDPKADDFEIEDCACLPGPVVLAVLRFRTSGKRYFTPLLPAPPGTGAAFQEGSYHPEAIYALVQAMREQVTLATERQGSILFRAQPLLAAVASLHSAQALDVTAFQEGMSSNCLSQLRHPGGLSVFKVYKRLIPDTINELRALERLAGTRLAPELQGSIVYRRVDKLHVMGTLTSLVDAEPIYLLLSRHLKALCAQVVLAPERGIEQTRMALTELGPLCRDVGTYLLRFHRHLNPEASEPHAQHRHFQLGPYLDTHRARGNRLRAAVEGDDVVPPALRARLLKRLGRLSREVLSPECLAQLPPMSATIAHGDLHLSHLLVSSRPEEARVCILDVSPRCLDEEAPAFLTQTVLQDVVSIHRAIQYFAFDEIMDAIKDVLGVSQFDATQRVLEQPEQLPFTCRALLQVLSEWTQGLFSAMESAYLSALGPGDPLDLPPAYTRLFYTCRLLQEMEYNYDYRRSFFKYCDFYYLLQMEGLD